MRARQPAIRDVVEAFARLSAGVFEKAEERAGVQAALVREGVFRELSLARAKGQAVKNHRGILAAWSKLLTEARPAREMLIDDGREEPASERERKDKTPVRVDRAKVLENVQSQKQLIVNAMARKEIARAYNLIDELVKYQLKNGEPIYAAKSLCDLAMQAQRRDLHELQVDLLRRATRLRQDDAWSWAQLGKALQNVNNYPEALSAYENARQYGAGAVAETGRAEVLKAMGDLPDALRAYEEVGKAHPSDVVAKTGRAEVLKAMGDLPEALRAYESIRATRPENKTARHGHAHVLAAMRRWDEALSHLPDQPPMEEQDWIGYHIRGMILLRTSNLRGAEQIFAHGVEHDPFFASRDHYRSALALVRLRRREYRAAFDLLTKIELPLLQTPANVLRTHALGFQGETAQAIATYRLLPEQGSPIYADIRDELRRRFVDGEPPQHDENWLINSEIELLAA